MLEIDGKTLCGSCFEEQVTDSDICDLCGFDNSAALENTGTLPMGMLLSQRYIIGKVLGRGGFGITYLAYDKVNAQRVAVKEYFPDSLSYRTPGTITITNYSGDKEDYYKTGVEKFYGEAKILSRFNGNDHIINVMDFFYANNTAYYIMEYVNGIDLKQYISMKGGRLPFDEVLDFMVPVMYALIIVHSMDILHRDISPDNIYLTKNGDIKILDFGAARQVYGEQSSNLSVILKQGFTPIEQYRKRGNHGPWSDIYSLGATAYYALTGAVPEESVNRVESDDLLMPSQLGIPIPADFEMILRKMLAVKAEDRYQSMIELKEAMRGLGKLPASQGRPGPGEARRTAGRKTRPFKLVVGGAAALCLVVAVIAAWALLGTKSVTDKPYTLYTTAYRVDCSYTGQWKSDAPNGEGVLTIEDDVPIYWAAGVKLEGNFVDGLLQGEGKRTDKDGSVYTGGFKDGLQSGQGAYDFASGDKARGEYKNHFMNGKGSYEFANGAKYEGDFVDGLCVGQGKFIYSDGSTYEGDFKNDKENGEGVYTAEGWTYTGEFVDGEFHGHGVITDVDGAVLYDGAWEAGEMADPIPKRDVTGASYVYTTSVFTAPCTYTGEWENGMPNGRGTLVISEDGSEGDNLWFKGDTYHGNFVDGLLEGYGTYNSVLGDRYEGNFENGLYNGAGKYTSEEGNVYTGSFVDERFEGEGTFIFADGGRYEGGFLNNQFDGEGAYWDGSGNLVYSGRWANGEAVDVY